jgi:hypothetical protein
MVMFQQAFFAPLSHKNSVKIFFLIYTTFLILGGLPLIALSLPDSSGAVCLETSPHGRDLALLLAGQDSPPYPTLAIADPHPTMLFLSYPH